MNKLKKALIIIAAGTAAALGVCGIAACGDDELTGTFDGSYHYANSWGGSDYGVCVSVTVENGVIKSVTIIESDYVEATESWEDRDTYLNAREDLLKAYEGKTVKEVLAMKVACNEDGEPLTSTSEGFSEYDQSLLVTGATQSSGRLLLAVQDALKNA